MTDSRCPFKAMSDYDSDGGIPFVSMLPRDEEDFKTVDEARQWLKQSPCRSGIIEQLVNPKSGWYMDIEVVRPKGVDTAIHC